MVKQASSFVLASLRRSTYKEYASSFLSLRPGWVTCLTIP